MTTSSAPTEKRSSPGSYAMGFVDPPSPFDTPETWRSFIEELKAAPPSAQKNVELASAQKGLRRALADEKARNSKK